jgi:nitrogen-specific signal transduction histidine kinase
MRRTIAYQGRTSLFVTKVPALPPVRSDRDLLSLAVYNLVENVSSIIAERSVEVRARKMEKP